jgi:hypothetical protein
MTRNLPSVVYLLALVPSSAGQGFLFPGAFIALLSVSEQAEQAVVTSTMSLWRSLGMVLGVSSSSLVVQNALVVYLNKYVTGPDKVHVMNEVRKSVEAIKKLKGEQLEQVIRAYEASLRATFVVTMGLAVLAVSCVIGIRMPRLGKRPGS